MYFHQQPETTIPLKWNSANAANIHQRKKIAEQMLKGLLVLKYAHFKYIRIQRT